MGKLEMATADHSAVPVTAQKRNPPSIAGMLLDIAWRMSLVALALAGVMSVIYFPYSTDVPLSAAEQSDLQKYYATAYRNESTSVDEQGDSDYVRAAKEAA